LKIAETTETQNLSDGASRYLQATQFLAQAGLGDEAQRSRALAFDCIRRAVDQGGRMDLLQLDGRRWQHNAVEVRGPARIDLGGGWSDTPPFCLDWGGTVLNIALTLNGEHPISTSIRRLDERLVRCVSSETAEVGEYRDTEAAMAPPTPGSALSIPRAALQLAGIARPGQRLSESLDALGGGIEIKTEVNLPLGSGLGTSSILAATLLRALAVMA
ncbi:MAG: hypothetical protein GY953_52705, partial [bacterium]|nr:hypothetical protein [bacterium]